MATFQYCLHEENNGQRTPIFVNPAIGQNTLHGENITQSALICKFILIKAVQYSIFEEIWVVIS